MSHTRSTLKGYWLSLAIAGTLTGLFLIGATAANAGCPVGKETTDGQKAGATAHKDVDEKLLGQIDLAKEKVNIPGRLLRMRRLVVQPGGEVAWHSHEDRPALIYIISGTITEYSSHCSVPIEHPAGDLSVESGGLSHWWKNNGKEPTTLISADLAKDPNEHGM